MSTGRTNDTDKDSSMMGLLRDDQLCTVNLSTQVNPKEDAAWQVIFVVNSRQIRVDYVLMSPPVCATEAGVRQVTIHHFDSLLTVQRPPALLPHRQLCTSL